MKQILVLVILLCAIVSQSSGQKKDITLTLDEKEYFVDRLDLGDAGFILKSTQRLFYYTPACDLVWEKKINDRHSVGENFTVASPDGTVVYHVSAVLENFSKKPQYVTQIKKDGQLKEFEIPPSKELGKNVISIFCDNNYLYYLTLAEGKDKKNKEVVVVNRFSAVDMKHSSVSPGLPAGEDSYWYFLGQKDNVKYVANKDIDMQRPENSITVVGFNGDGGIVSTLKIPVSLDKKFSRPALNVNAPAKGWMEVEDNDFSIKSSTMSVPGGSAVTYNQQNMAYGTGPKTVTTRGASTEYSSTLLREKQGAYCHISLDEKTGAFYIYSLLGTKPFNKSGIGNVYEGFYALKFDEKGTNVWKLQYNGAAELEEEKYFRVHGMPADRHINLLMLPGGKLNFTIRFKKSRVSYDISPEGKILTTDKREGLHFLAGSYVSSSWNPPANRADKGKSDDDMLMTNFLTTQGQVILEGKQEKKGGVLKMTFSNNNGS